MSNRKYSVEEVKPVKQFIMRTISISILGLLLITLISCQPTLVKDTNVVAPQVVSTFQQSMLEEINFARTNPSGYAELRLKTTMLESADNGSYLYLKSLTPLASLIFNNALNLSASAYALYLAENNLMGHNLDGTPLKRAMAVGFAGSLVGENIAASTGSNFNSVADPKNAAIYFVQLMIIDANVSDLGHRLTLLSPNYSTIGIGYSQNLSSTYINYNVQDFGNQ